MSDFCAAATTSFSVIKRRSMPYVLTVSRLRIGRFVDLDSAALYRAPNAVSTSGWWPMSIILKRGFDPKRMEMTISILSQSCQQNAITHYHDWVAVQYTYPHMCLVIIGFSSKTLKPPMALIKASRPLRWAITRAWEPDLSWSKVAILGGAW